MAPGDTAHDGQIPNTLQDTPTHWSNNPAGSFDANSDSYMQGEILPPQPMPSEAPPPRQRRQGWAAAPATYSLVGINCAVLILMGLNGVSIFDPQSEQLIRWGANVGPLVLDGAWWRLATAMFVHVGLLHLAANMWCLWNLGLLGEPLLGAIGLIAVYLVTGFAGDLLSVATHSGLGPDARWTVGAGASGAVFGIAGALLVLLRSRRLPIPDADRRSLRKNVFWFALLNFGLGAGINIAHTSLLVDNSAHLGGFAAGLLIALPMVPRIGTPRREFARKRALALVAGVVVMLLLCVGVRAYFNGAA